MKKKIDDCTKFQWIFWNKINETLIVKISNFTFCSKNSMDVVQTIYCEFATNNEINYYNAIAEASFSPELFFVNCRICKSAQLQNFLSVVHADIFNLISNTSYHVSNPLIQIQFQKLCAIRN